MLPECKTKDENFGREQWLKFKNAIIAWRLTKIQVFQDPEGLDAITLKKLKEEVLKMSSAIYRKADRSGMIHIRKSDLGGMLAVLKNYKL